MQGAAALEIGADDADPVMPPAGARAGMTDVLVAVIDDVQRFDAEGSLQPLADHVDSAAHGNTFLNGRTSTFA